MSMWTGKRAGSMALAAVPVVAPVVEMAVLLATGVTSGLGLAPQVTAVGPFGVFHDLRWLMVFHESVPAFAVGLLVIVVGRSALTAAMVLGAWPAERVRPTFWRAFRMAAVATPVGLLLLSPWAALLFGTALVPLSWTFFAAVPPALFTIVLLNHSPVVSDWWRHLPPLRSVAWVAVSFGALSLGALAATGGPALLAMAAALFVGLFNAKAWQGVVGAALVQRRSSVRWVPVTPVVAALVFLGVVSGSALGFDVAGGDPERAVASAATPAPGQRPILLVAGFSGECCHESGSFAVERGNPVFEQFSYLGLDESGRPRPHGGSSTDGDLAVLASLMADQVEYLHAVTGRQVAIVAESEGTLITELYLDLHPSAPVDRVMLLSPIPRPARVSYPDRGQEGPGVVAGYQLRVVSAVIDAIAPFEVEPDGPLARSLKANGSLLEDAGLPVASPWDVTVVMPLADAVMAAGAAYDDSAIVVLGFHGGLRAQPDVQRMIEDWAAGGELAETPGWLMVGRIIAASATAWLMPDL